MNNSDKAKHEQKTRAKHPELAAAVDKAVAEVTADFNAEIFSNGSFERLMNAQERLSNAK